MAVLDCSRLTTKAVLMFRCRLAASLALLLFVGSASACADDPAGIEFFEAKIRPVLVQHCYECHSAESKPLKAGLRLDTRESMRQGGESGAAVTPGSVAQSLVISALKYDGFEMPPQGRLHESVVKDFEKWIEMGAPDPREGEAAEVAKAIDFDKAAQLWAFRPPVKAPLPTVRDTSWPKNEIDHFVLARIEQESLHPVRPASKQQLIRRATFDLLGLPPTPQEVAAYVADDSPNAYAQLIDRLLESPHYGERWGRHWLDVARFADDQAHTFGVKPNSEAWRYRQWVIEAFNRDLPYNDFVRMQIAGDQLDPAAGFDRYIALGYFGLGAVYYKNSDKAKAEADELDDRIDTLTRGFLGLTVSCARCHDHKFDPIPTSDYYSLAGIFNSSPLATIPLADQSVVDTYNQGQQHIKQSEKQLNDRTLELRETQAESHVNQVDAYVQAIWKQRVAKARQETLSPKQLATSFGLAESSIVKWSEFLSEGRKGKHPLLEPWFLLPTPTAETPIDSIPDNVQQVAKTLQQEIQNILNERDGKPVEKAPSLPERTDPVYSSPLITRDRLSVEIDVELNGAKELYLVITDGADGKSCDHADWIEPKLITASGEQKLTDLKWRSAVSGYGSINLNRGVEGGPLRIADKQYENGIGTHAPCVIVYDLPAGTQRFRSTAGLDLTGSAQGGGTVNFLLYTSPPPISVTFEAEDEDRKPSEKKLSKEKIELLKDVFGDGGLFRLPDDQFQDTLTEVEVTELAQLQTQLDEARKAAPAMYPSAHAIRDNNPQNMKVFVRGNPARQGEIAPRQFLRILSNDQRTPYDQGSGRRQLADDIASNSNPLTARVMVNRVWQQHFGRGIVATPSNFGQMGDPPTHPELLDWLTVDFIEHGWSLKSLHRQIMRSATYQLSSDNDISNAEIDGDAKWLWRMNRRRLDVEAWRDSLLAVSGQLDTKLGGENVGLNGNRRTVYAKISRHELDELLRLFDFPDANVTSEKRTVTTVPQQQLFMLNSSFMVQQATALSNRLKAAAATDKDRIEAAFPLLFSRPATEREVQIGLDFLTNAGTDAPGQKIDAWQQYAQALLSLNEFMYID